MRFLEKDLEAIIFNQLDYCRERGLTIEPSERKVLRQLNLAPYGIADLVHIGYDRIDDRLHVRIIECKRDVVDAATYTQAARYQHALKAILECSDTEFFFEKTLIGKRIDTRKDFWHLIDGDEFCKVFTYWYGADGIRFKLHKPMDEIDNASAMRMHQPSVLAVLEAAESIASQSPLAF